MNCAELPPAPLIFHRSSLITNGLDGGALCSSASVVLAGKDDKFGEKYAGRLATPEGGPGAALPLRVGFVVFVPLMFDHPEAADADVRSGHLHPVQGDPARGEGRKGSVSARPDQPEKASGGKYVVVSVFCALLYLLQSHYSAALLLVEIVFFKPRQQ